MKDNKIIVNVILAEDDWYAVNRALRETGKPALIRLAKNIEEQVMIDVKLREALS